MTYTNVLMVGAATLALIAGCGDSDNASAGTGNTSTDGGSGGTTAGTPSGVGTGGDGGNPIGMGGSGGAGSGGAPATGGGGVGGGAPDVCTMGMFPGGATFNGCTDSVAMDMTGMAEINIDWSSPLITPDSCFLISVGTVVHFNGDFAANPLAGGWGGMDANDCISNSDQSGTTTSIQFNVADHFPYFSLNTVLMQGVIYVTN
jgi:hypothetical protein